VFAILRPNVLKSVPAIYDCWSYCAEFLNLLKVWLFFEAFGHLLIFSLVKLVICQFWSYRLCLGSLEFDHAFLAGQLHSTLRWKARMPFEHIQTGINLYFYILKWGSLKQNCPKLRPVI
jgi:hypothetical protein